MKDGSMENALTSPAPRPRRVGLLILSLAYAGFIGLGMVNSLLGVAWPSIHATFGLPLDALGVLLIGITIGYMIASAVSGRLLALLGGGTLLALSSCLAAASLLAAGSAPSWAVLVAFGFTSGLSGGAIDGGLNAYAAAHFSPRAMNWLHACFGIGATLGPAIMTAVITGYWTLGGLGWRAGYWIVGAAQLALALCFALTRQRWHDPASPQAAAASPPQAAHGAPLVETLRLPLAWLGIALFFAYTGLEIATGNWVYSLLTEARGVPAALAGTWVSLYWGSLTAGRILFGFVVQRISPTTLLRWCMAGATLSALLIWMNLAPWLASGGIALMGLALAPQFPLLISATPGYLGPRHAANGVGFQVAAAGLGGALVPSLVGVLARAWGLEVLGPFLFAAALTMAALFELLLWRLPARAGEAKLFV
jgi:fucose permease